MFRRRIETTVYLVPVTMRYIRVVSIRRRDATANAAGLPCLLNHLGHLSRKASNSVWNRYNSPECAIFAPALPAISLRLMG